MGNGKNTLPVYLGTALVGELFGNIKPLSVVGQWGKRSVRAILTGVLPMLFFQRVLGGSRPTEGESHWRDSDDDNGVSGHSFMGAVPFITAVKMTQNKYLKCLFYLGSTLCGLSRINDNAHYFSQVALGWYMAYLAASSINSTDNGKNIPISITPLIIKGEFSLGTVITFKF